MKRRKDHVFPSALFPTEVERRAFLKYTGAGLGGVALSPMGAPPARNSVLLMGQPFEATVTAKGMPAG